MGTRRDGITTWVASFAKNLFFFFARVYSVCTCTITWTCPDDKEQWENRPGHPLTIHLSGI